MEVAVSLAHGILSAVFLVLFVLVEGGRTEEKGWPSEAAVDQKMGPHSIEKVEDKEEGPDIFRGSVGVGGVRMH